MDKYLENVAAKHLYNWYGFFSPEDMKPHLPTLLPTVPEDEEIWGHIFHNCRMFHESPCEECEYRFKCYTT